MVNRAKKTKSAKSKKAAPGKTKQAQNKASNSRDSENIKALHETRERLKHEVEQAYKAFCRDMKQKNEKDLHKDTVRLQILIGECQYLRDEYAKCLPKQKK